MTLAPQKFREIVFLLLYSQGFFDLLDEEIVPMVMRELKVSKRSCLEAKAKVNEIVEKMGEIDKMIQKASTEYSFDRISRIEKTILRLGLFEVLFDAKMPPKVAISEAIRLTRKFGTPESSNFVNAIMDAVYQNGMQDPAFSEKQALK